MAVDHRERLRSIRSFPSLVKYLRDELDWPIVSEDFEELTFDYTPEELGIDTSNAAKIQEIKRMRPLSIRQPWGIFFVQFEPKRLPVVALRRILNRVVLKKRASANSADREAWETEDLLFISNYGEGENRQISLAHFGLDGQKNGLATLNVLGWDNRDTALHLDDVADALDEHLRWPDDDSDADSWRDSWRSAFTLRHREVITTSRELSIRLAKLAQDIRKRINSVLSIETEDGPVSKLMAEFKEALVHDLDNDGFADMYAQTIAYGLLSARVANPSGGTSGSFAARMPVTNPFLKELMETFLDVGGSNGSTDRGPGLDFDELGVSDVVELLDDANMEAVVHDFGDRNPQEDPVIHFFEGFLQEYDKTIRKDRGVFYTPRPVVSYIVRSVDELLRTEFGLENGLADTSTWGDMAQRHTGLAIPDGISGDQAFVQILDPATGTGTFLVEVIDLIYKTMTEKWRREGQMELEIPLLWNEYVPNHLLPRLHGFELMMAPYAIAHLKIGLKLVETGYRFESDERARVYLTNTLESPQDFTNQFPSMTLALAHEAEAVNVIKRDQLFTVVIGNPPYSSISSNMGKWIREEANTYIEIDGERIKEKSKRNPLQNDYVKFLRIADIACSLHPFSVFGYITSSSYLDGRTFRGLRWHLLQRYSLIQILNLYGDIRKRDAIESDENVFDISEGVSIITACRNELSDVEVVKYGEIQGSRKAKYEQLVEKRGSTEWTEIAPTAPYYLFKDVDESVRVEFLELGPSLQQLFRVSGAGLITNRDRFVTDWDEEALMHRMYDFSDESLTDEEIRNKYRLKDNSVWKLPKARLDFQQREVSPAKLVSVAYRPFDNKIMYYDKAVVFNPRFLTMNHMLHGNNLALVSTGQTESHGFNHVFVTTHPVEKKLATHYGASIIFPLYLYVADSQVLGPEGTRQLNIQPDHGCLNPLSESTADDIRDFDGSEEFEPQEVLSYIICRPPFSELPSRSVLGSDASAQTSPVYRNPGCTRSCIRRIWPASGSRVDPPSIFWIPPRLEEPHHNLPTRTERFPRSRRFGYSDEHSLAGSTRQNERSRRAPRHESRYDRFHRSARGGLELQHRRLPGLPKMAQRPASERG